VYLLVATGTTVSGISNNTEIVDLSGSNKTCQNFPQYSISVSTAVGMIGPKNYPIICGGFDGTFYIKAKHSYLNVAVKNYYSESHCM
jgi:hypothetical protein